MEMTIPRLNKTGDYAMMELTMRQSRRNPTVVNVRLSLPRRSMYVAVDGDVMMVPPAAGETGGHPIAQIPLSQQ